MEGLKLIDLGNEVSYIDVDTSKVPYTFSVKLGDRTFAFSIRYNEVGGFFTVDMADRCSTAWRMSASRCRSLCRCA